jgi:DNA-binding MarR family transcriptional regulator
MQGKLSRTQDNPLEASISHAVTRLFREQNRLHGRAIQSFGLSTEQAQLLLVLWTFGPMSMTELGREVALSSGTLTTAIDRMEAAGLVKRVSDPDDRRAVRVEAGPWPTGQRQKLLDTLLATEAAMLTPLSAKERTTLLALLTRILDNLEPTLGRKATRSRPPK